MSRRKHTEAQIIAIVKEVESGGIWCPARVSKTLKSVPGQITVFVKKPTWWQSHGAG